MILQGDALTRLRELPTGTAQTCCTSPPYYGLRDYGTGGWTGGDPDCDHSHAPTRTVGNAPSSKSTLTTNNGAGPRPGDKFHADQRREVATACPCGAARADSQLGLEATPDEFVARLVEVFREVRRVLRDDGTLWLNMGDSYVSATGGTPSSPGQNARVGSTQGGVQQRVRPSGYKPKDLLGIPWMLAFALRADGWYLRSDVIWAKPNPMPESVTDRPTQAHEHLFLLTKSPRYFYDAEAIREAAPERLVKVPDGWDTSVGEGGHGSIHQQGRSSGASNNAVISGRNKRNVWEIATQPYPLAHFATFPTRLVEPCILAGSSPRACGQCGAPWERVVERGESAYARLKREEGVTWQDMTEHAHEQGMDLKGGSWSVGGTRKPNGVMAQLDRGPTQTVGWQPTCDHQDDSGRCLVLDPFAGSGTVGVVSAWHRRDFLGIELNGDYCAMAEQRIAIEGRGGRLKAPPEQIDGQIALFS